eukprot:1856526-Rhodomonas_salina.2
MRASSRMAAACRSAAPLARNTATVAFASRSAALRRACLAWEWSCRLALASSSARTACAASLSTATSIALRPACHHATSQRHAGRSAGWRDERTWRETGKAGHGQGCRGERRRRGSAAPSRGRRASRQSAGPWRPSPAALPASPRAGARWQCGGG